MFDTLASLQSTLSTLWVVWFFLLFAGIILYVMAPRRRRRYEAAGEIPLRDEAPSAIPSKSRAPSARR